MFAPRKREFHEEDVNRDDIGRFTFKNSTYSSNPYSTGCWGTNTKETPKQNPQWGNQTDITIDNPDPMQLIYKYINRIADQGVKPHHQDYYDLANEILNYTDKILSSNPDEEELLNNEKDPNNIFNKIFKHGQPTGLASPVEEDITMLQTINENFNEELETYNKGLQATPYKTSEYSNIQQNSKQEETQNQIPQINQGQQDDSIYQQNNTSLKGAIQYNDKYHLINNTQNSNTNIKNNARNTKNLPYIHKNQTNQNTKNINNNINNNQNQRIPDHLNPFLNGSISQNGLPYFLDPYQTLNLPPKPQNPPMFSKEAFDQYRTQQQNQRNQIAKQAQEIGEAERKEYDRQLKAWQYRNFGGTALELSSIPLYAMGEGGAMAGNYIGGFSEGIKQGDDIGPAMQKGSAYAAAGLGANTLSKRATGPLYSKISTKIPKEAMENFNKGVGLSTQKFVQDLGKGSIQNALETSARSSYNLFDNYRKTGDMNFENEKDNYLKSLAIGTLASAAPAVTHYFREGVTPGGYNKSVEGLKEGRSKLAVSKIDNSKIDYDNFRGSENQHVKLGNDAHIKVKDRSSKNSNTSISYKVEDFNAVDKTLSDLKNQGYNIELVRNGYTQGVDTKSGFRSIDYRVSRKGGGVSYDLKFTTPEVLAAEDKVLELKNSLAKSEHKLRTEKNRGEIEELQREIQNTREAIKSLRYNSEIKDADIIGNGLKWLYEPHRKNR